MLLKEQDDGDHAPVGADEARRRRRDGPDRHVRRWRARAGLRGVAGAADRRGGGARPRGGRAPRGRGPAVSRRNRSGGLDGVLVVAKPSGPTSHDVVDLVRRLSSTRRVGHGGTLDPFAAGVLPLFLGRATRLVEYHLGATKRYRATVCFGETSTTDDIDGERTPVDGPAPTREAVEAALAGLRRAAPPGPADLQRGPGRGPARLPAGAPRRDRGPRRARDVVIHAVTLLEWDATDPARPIADRRRRVLGRDVHPGAGAGPRVAARHRRVPRRAGADRVGRVPPRGRGLVRVAPRARGRRAGGHRRGSCARSTPASRTCPTPTITEDEVRRLGEGLITAPEAVAAGPRRAARARGRPGRAGRGRVPRRGGRAAPAQGAGRGAAPSAVTTA